MTTAERLRSLEAAGKAGSRAVRYVPAAAERDEVFLHPRSPLAAAAPAMALYTELLQTDKRAFMSGVPAHSQVTRCCQMLPDSVGMCHGAAPRAADRKPPNRVKLCLIYPLRLLVKANPLQHHHATN